MKKVIVTGGLGFIGSNLINILKEKYFVINIDKVTYASNFNNIRPEIKNYQFYKIGFLLSLILKRNPNHKQKVIGIWYQNPLQPYSLF